MRCVITDSENQEKRHLYGPFFSFFASDSPMVNERWPMFNAPENSAHHFDESLKNQILSTKIVGQNNSQIQVEVVVY